MNKKRKTHSTQRKYFNTIPRSEFYGFVLGYALGLIDCGALRLDTQIPQIALAAVGLGIGYYIDIKYFQAPNEPVEEAGQEDGPADASVAARASGQEDSSDM